MAFLHKIEVLCVSIEELARMGILGIFASKNSFCMPKTDIKGVFRLPK